MLDQLPHFLMDILRIDIAEYRAEKSLISPTFVPSVRTVHEHDYVDVHHKTVKLKNELERSWDFDAYLKANDSLIRPQTP